MFLDDFGFFAFFPRMIGAKGIQGDMSKTVKSLEGLVGINLFAFSPFRLSPPASRTIVLGGAERA